MSKETTPENGRSSVPLDTTVMPFYLTDRYGWPIERIKGKPVFNFCRVVCQNLKKIPTQWWVNDCTIGGENWHKTTWIYIITGKHIGQNIKLGLP